MDYRSDHSLTGSEITTISPEWRFCLFGELLIEFQGRACPPPPYRTQSLLAALLIKPQRRSREALLTLLFPDLPESKSRQRLSDLLWLLRKSLPGLPIVSSAEEIALPLESRWLDVEQFLAHIENGQAKNRLEACQLGLASYRGDLLPECLDDWLLIEREVLRMEYVELLRHTSQLLINQNLFAEALTHLQNLIQQDPLDEDALRLLIQSHAALGQRGAALAAFDRYTNLLRQELDLEPEEATRSLVKAIRDAAPHGVQQKSVIPPQASPEKIVSLAQAALAQADYATTTACLDLLRANPSAGGDLRLRLLEIDLALAEENIPSVDKLLRACDPGQLVVVMRQARLAFLRLDWEEGYRLASRAAILALDASDPLLLREALLVLAEAESRVGRLSEARRSIEKALRLKQGTEAPLELAQAHYILGYLWYRMSCHHEAMTEFRQAESLACQYGLRRQLAVILRTIANNLGQLGRPREAMTVMQQELSLWQDLGLIRREAQTLVNLAEIEARLGKKSDSLNRYDQAREIFTRLSDDFGIAVCQYNTAATLMAQDDRNSKRALSIAQQAWKYFHAGSHSDWEASTLEVLGIACWLDGQTVRAVEYFQLAYEGYQQLGELFFLPVVLALKALALIGSGNTGDALACTQQALMQVAQGALDNENAVDVYYSRAMALDSVGERDQARDYIERGYQVLLRFASELDDEAARQAFFDRNPITRRLMKEAYRCGIATPPVEMQLSQLPLTRARPNKAAVVTWVSNAGPADEALQQSRGPVALRRVRLARLIREADAQGARPTLGQLGEIFGVSPRTIQRDLNALQASS